MTILKPVFLAFLYMTLVAAPAQAMDNAREQRWARQVVDFLATGEPQWLNAEGQKFLSIYTPSSESTTSGNTKGAVILLHDQGVHPAWPRVIQPLRTQLPAQGWATLSLQMPVLSREAKPEDYIPVFKFVPVRIQAALEFLTKQGVNNIILLGHGLGANMATDYLVKHHDTRIKAFIGIDMAGNRQPTGYLVLDNVSAMLQMKIPILDVYGSKTNPAVLNSADRRAFAVYQTGNFHSRQIKIDNANSFFEGHEDELLHVITKWIAEFSTTKQSDQFVSTNNPLHSK